MTEMISVARIDGETQGDWVHRRSIPGVGVKGARSDKRQANLSDVSTKIGTI